MSEQYIYPWGVFPIDDSTGMPVLPNQGTFWRVKRVSAGLYLQVELRKRLFVGSRRVSYSIGMRPTTRKWILDGAAYCLVQLRKNALLGDYPPKKLETSR